MDSIRSAGPGLTAEVGELSRHVGTSLGLTAWRSVSQEEVNAFADLTDDHNPIHVDPERAAGTRFGGTIVHGYYTVSLLAPLLDELLDVRGASTSVNYGFEKVRFPAPLPVGSRFRARAELAEASDIPGGVQIRLATAVEVEAACSATTHERRLRPQRDVGGCHGCRPRARARVFDGARGRGRGRRRK